MLPQGPVGPAPARHLLPVIAQTRPGRRVVFARMDQASGLVDRCWSFVPGPGIEAHVVRLEPGRLHPELGAGEFGRTIHRLDPAAVLLLQELIPPLRDGKLQIQIRTLADRGTVIGYLVIADTRSWLRRARQDFDLIDALAEYLEGELVRDSAQTSALAALQVRLAEKETEVERLANRLAALEVEVVESRRTVDYSGPRLNALEHAVGRGTEMLADVHEELERVERQARRFRCVFEALRKLLERHADGTPPRELAAQLVRVVADAFQGTRCSLLLSDPDPKGRDSLRLAASLGFPEDVDPSRIRVRLGEGISGWVAINGAELVVRDPADAEQLPLVNDDGYTGPAFVSFPLFCHGRFGGVLNLTNFEEGTFDDAELEALRLVALSVALVVDHARLSERMFALDDA
jgi:uncharacterized protein (DUF2267 family)